MQESDGKPSLGELLNISVPYAPGSGAEIQDRLSAAEHSKIELSPKSEQDVPGRMATSSNPPEECQEGPVDGVSPFPPGTPAPVIGAERGGGELLRTREALARARAARAELAERMAREHVRHTSGDGHVRVVTDVYGGILELHVDPACSRGRHTRTTGRGLVEAILAARRAANELREEAVYRFPAEDDDHAGEPR